MAKEFAVLCVFGVSSYPVAKKLREWGMIENG